MRGQFSWVAASGNRAVASRGRKDPEIQKLQKLKPTKKLAEVPRPHPYVYCMNREQLLGRVSSVELLQVQQELWGHRSCWGGPFWGAAVLG